MSGPSHTRRHAARGAEDPASVHELEVDLGELYMSSSGLLVSANRPASRERDTDSREFLSEPTETSDFSIFKADIYMSDVRNLRSIQRALHVAREALRRHSEAIEQLEEQQQQCIDRLREQLVAFTRGELSVEAYTLEFLRLGQQVPEMMRDNAEVNSIFVTGLGPEFRELLDEVDCHFGYVSGRAQQIESVLEREGTPVRAFPLNPERPVPIVDRPESSVPRRRTLVAWSAM
ncbi:uncharacterized protein LOC126669602 [Mercurialis annua]|uniref:uncharacterized protein LOC126669602 n=1 Tax=Mercurialis annua TaxID=3986 RepID=UPI00215E75BB|nr:uncharacterized protein LOC126669602 [Mercurialis annua]